MKIIVASSQNTDGQPRWTPNTDIFVSSGGELIIMLELAGLTRTDLELSVDGARLRVQGHRRYDDQAGGKYLVMEIAGGPFETLLEVPVAYDLPNATAFYEHGFLRVVVPQRTR
jgi:HSP20 family molecular chaperone IbpA